MDHADMMLVGFKSHLRVETIPAQAVCLISERGMTALSGPSIERLAPLLDGTRTVGRVKQELSEELSEAEVEQLLGRLRDADLLALCQTEAVHRLDGEAEAYLSLAGVEVGSAAEALAAAAVEIICTGSVRPEKVAAACRESGLRAQDPGSGPVPLCLVVCDDYLDPALTHINAERLADGRPWLLAKPYGAVAWIGPVFRPGEGACWACLAKRLAGNRPGGFLTRGSAYAPWSPPPASLPASRAIGLQVAVLEAVKRLAGIRHEGQECVKVIDTLTMHGEHHRVARRPQCPACGDRDLIARQAGRPLRTVVREIAKDGISKDSGNGQRTLGLEAVLERYGHLVDPVTGIVGELRRNPDSPPFLSAYLSGRNRAMTESSIGVLRAGLRAHSGGKGVTEIEAKVGALCEAVERYCATLAGDELVVRDSYHGLGDAAVHPDACQLFHERQYIGRARWNAACMPFHRVPEPFDERAVTDWTPVWSLLSGQQRLLPTALLYFRPDPGGAPVSVLANSNGCAAGTTLEDAILQGFFELVERDAVGLWWYNRTRQPGVSLDSFDDPWIANVPELYARLRRQVWLLDLTSDLGIPVMAAVSRRTDKPSEDIVLGFGAHFDPRIAARRALTELGQLLPPVVDADADGGGYRLSDPHLMSWWATVTCQSQPYLLPQPTQPRTAASYGYQVSHTIDCEPIRAIARRTGLDILVLDQTRPDIGMPVVKVVVPGLRHFWPRFAPGRLFDVPVRLGRLAAPTAYEDLNPIPLYVLHARGNSSPRSPRRTPNMTLDHGYGALEGRSELWSLREDVQLSQDSAEGPVRLHHRWGEVTIERPSPLLREALHRMRLGPISLNNVIGTRLESEETADAEGARMRLLEVLDKIQPLVIRTLGFGSGQPLLSVVPLTPQARFHPVPIPLDAHVRLSTFAQLRTDGREYRLESPLALHRVQLHRPEAVWLIGLLARPITASADAWASLAAISADALAYLVAAGVVVQTPGPNGSEHDVAPSLTEEPARAGWSPVDLMFHSRNTTGRHDNPFGITYPLGRAGSPEPVVKPGSAQGIALHRPRWEDLAADPPLAVAMEGRRSTRVHGAEPVTVDELGDLLYRTARVRALITPPAGGPTYAGDPDPRLSDRPYPGGGACYELELYVTVGQCTGISPGIYHYDPLGHRLEPVNSDGKMVRQLLMSAAECATMDVAPQLLITITARYQRISWKYEGVTYAAVLKDVGVLYQSLYLVCTAMRLAPCALGSVRADATAHALGTDWMLEPSVGQFILGRAPNAPVKYDWEWEPVNDAQWHERARQRLSEPVTLPAARHHRPFWRKIFFTERTVMSRWPARPRLRSKKSGGSRCACANTSSRDRSANRLSRY